MENTKLESKEAEFLDFWCDRWATDKTGWHDPEVNIYLQKYFERLRSTKGKGEDFKVLVPLCGKSLDIKWLLDKGCSVVGIEGVEKPIKSLFEQHNLSYSKINLQKDDFLYQCEGLPLKVYKCNLFDFPMYNTQKFDLIWDRGSFVALNYEQREQYASVMKSLYAEPFLHLIESFNYKSDTFDDSLLDLKLLHTGPPRKVLLPVVKELLGEDFNYEQLEETDGMKMMERLNAQFEFIHILIFLISPK